MQVAKAQALVPNLMIMDADPLADQASLERLALWALQRYSPMVGVDAPDGLVIDSTGADHLHGGESAMLSAMIGQLASSGIAARAAIADSWGAAHAFARYEAKSPVVIPIGETVGRLNNLPIASLRLPADIIGSLKVLGFERVSELAAQPRAPLTLRFGPQLWRRLDQAMGKLAEPIDPMRSPDLIETSKGFAEPISAAETIARYIEKLVVQLCAALEGKGLGAKRLDLIFYRVDNSLQAIRVGTATPVRNVKRLSRLLCEKIENVDPGFGIEKIVLMATLAEPLTPKQVISSLADEPEDDVSDLVDTLANRIGSERLYCITPIPSDVPERSFGRVGPMAAKASAGWSQKWPRPSRLLSPPEIIDTVALLPDHPPVSFTWRGIRRRVKRADGPERIFGEWWKRDAELEAVRDYFRVEDETGERFWLYRAGDGVDAGTGSHRWFLHGIFG
jgi:protein ImuB